MKFYSKYKPSFNILQLHISSYNLQYPWSQCSYDNKLLNFPYLMNFYFPCSNFLFQTENLCKNFRVTNLSVFRTDTAGRTRRFHEFYFFLVNSFYSLYLLW
jgi:hypothetical protein